MDWERWRLVKDLYQSVVERPAEQHDAYLAQACGDDRELRREIESLLEQRGRSGVLDTPPSGGRLGPYLILEKIGAGGMGAVFKACDTRLDRIVALKISTPQFSRRLGREARAISALNHPHICSLYDIGERDGVGYFVMEHLEGETLATSLGRGPLPIHEVLLYGSQISGAVTAAHAEGIVHCDLKPANIMLTKTGVKVLDFGIAKQPGAGEPQTAEGAIFGTLAYMSPEQAEGKPVDARTDIFSFGSVLYEMATGRRAFHGHSTAATLAAILEREPAMAGLPPDLKRIVSRCLRKDPARRFQHMGDVQVELEELKAERIFKSQGRYRRLWVAAAVLTLATVLLWWSRGGAPADDLRPVALTSYAGFEGIPSFSPDGSKVAFDWNGDDNNFDIYVKQVGAQGPPVRLTSASSH